MLIVIGAALAALVALYHARRSFRYSRDILERVRKLQDDNRRSSERVLDLMDRIRDVSDRARELMDRSTGLADRLRDIVTRTQDLPGGMPPVDSFTVAERSAARSWDALVTLRYVEAIKLLGSANRTERLGGIYALERIMRESEDDHAAVVQVLAAHVRHEAPGPGPEEAADMTHEHVQAALTVIGRRPAREERFSIDLARTDLRGAFLVDARLEGALLDSARLERANMVGARLARAFLVGAALDGAFLVDARLEGAHLVGARLERAHLVGARLDRAVLAGAFLERALLAGARLTGAHLEGADLRNADLDGADLSHAVGLRAEQLAAAVLFPSTRLPAELAGDKRVVARIEECEGRRGAVALPASASDGRAVVGVE